MTRYCYQQATTNTETIILKCTSASIKITNVKEYLIGGQFTHIYFTLYMLNSSKNIRIKTITFNPTYIAT